MVGQAPASGASACCWGGVNSLHNGLVSLFAARGVLGVDAGRIAVEAVFAAPMVPVGPTACAKANRGAAARPVIKKKATVKSRPVDIGSGLRSGAAMGKRMRAGVITRCPT